MVKWQNSLLHGRENSTIVLPPESISTNFVTTQNANHNINFNDFINCIREEDAMRKVHQLDASQNTSAMIVYKTRQTLHRP